MVGKRIRMERIMDRSAGKTVIVPMDHGVTLGPMPGLVDMRRTIDAMAMGGANAIVIHKGLVEAGHRRGGKDVGLIVHLSASTAISPDPSCKVFVCCVEEAIKLGADAVSIHVNIGAEDERVMLRDMGQASKEAANWGMPLFAMMYTRGPKVKNEFDVKVVKHAARVGAELGADIVKVVYTGCPDSFHEVVAGCFVPVVIAGGEKMETDREILEMVKASVMAGGAGVSIGRNIFQHRDPERIVRVIHKLVHNGFSVEEGLEEMQSPAASVEKKGAVVLN